MHMILLLVWLALTTISNVVTIYSFVARRHHDHLLPPTPRTPRG